MVVRDAVRPVGLVHDEGGALQGAGADHTGEALRVVGFARGPQHAVGDGLPAGVALLQGVLRKQEEVSGELAPGSQLPRQARRTPAPQPDSRCSSPRSTAPPPGCRTAALAAAAHTGGR